MSRMLFTLVLLTVCFFMGLQQPPPAAQGVVAVTMRRAQKPAVMHAQADRPAALFATASATDTAAVTLTTVTFVPAPLGYAK